MSRRHRSSLLHATSLLTLGNAANRVLGMAYRMVLTRFLGAEGLGLFQMAMSLYFALLLPVISGLPTALSRIVASQREEGVSPVMQRLVRMVGLLGLSALAVTAIIILRTKWTPPGESWDLARQLVPLPVLLPAIGFAVVAATLRGIFFGRQTVMPVVTSQFVEQSARLAMLGLLLTGAVVRWSLQVRLGIVLWNLVLGEAVACALLVSAYRRAVAQPTVVRPRQTTAETSAVPASLRAVVRLAIPVGLQRAVWSVSRLVEATLIPVILQKSGVSVNAAVAAYGELTGMAIPLLFMPSMFVHALSHTLVPGVAEVAQQPQALHRRVRRALALTADVGMAATLVVVFAGGWLTGLLFGFQPVGEPYAYAGRLATLFAPLAVLIYVDHICAAIARGLDRATGPLVVDFVAVSIRVGCLLTLTSQPLFSRLGMVGIAAIIIGSAALATLLDIMLVGRYSGLRWNVATPLLKALVAAAAALFIGKTVQIAVHGAMSDAVTAVLVAAVGLATYTAVRLGGELSSLPIGSGK